MQIKVQLNNLRIAPRKTRQIADLVRGKKAVNAVNILEFVVRKPANPVLKLLRSGIATAKHEFQLDENNLYISKIVVNEGPKLKRSRPVSRGSAHPLWKRTSHIELILDEVTPTSVKKIKETKALAVNEVQEAEVKEVASTGKKEKQKFAKTEGSKVQKGQGSSSRMFRRKSI